VLEIEGASLGELADLQRWLQDIPEKDLQGLQKIIRLNAGNRYPQLEYYHYDLHPSGRLYYRLSEVRGVYAVKGVIYLAQDGLNPRTLYHEIGHHVTMTNKWLTKRVQKILDTYLRGVSSMYPRDSKWDIIDLCVELAGPCGLRAYSFSSSLEFLADAYVILKRGSPYQRQCLEGFWEGIAPDERRMEELIYMEGIV